MAFWQWSTDLIAEVIFPKQCIACRSAGEWWCTSCRDSVERLRCDVCPACGSVVRAHECAMSLSSLNAITAVGFYHDPFLRSMITGLKYRGATCVVPDLYAFLSAWSHERQDPWPWAGLSALVIQHVPATPARVRMRGFDQAARIADAVQQILIPWGLRGDVLERKQGGVPQASLDPGILREANAFGSFSVVRKLGHGIPDAVLLVDDVLTTGSTMDEAARMLKQHGVRRVFGFVLAVGK